MISLDIKIYQKNTFWVLEVNSPNPNGKVYHFVKGEFKTQLEAKQFLLDHAGMFVLHMGQT